MNTLLKQLGIESLAACHGVFSKLLREGTAQDEIGLNQFGETVMRIDVVAENTILEHLSRYTIKMNTGVHVISEEHGELDIGNNPELTAYVDGLDGSSKFRDTKGKARCGTMFALYKGIEPAFEDYLCGGVVDHLLGWIVLAVKGQGVLLATGDGEAPFRVEGSAKRALGADTKIYIDEGIRNYPAFLGHEQDYFYDPIKQSFETRYLGSSAVYFFDLATGAADVVLEYGRKNNLEHMTGYPLAVESGGVMEFFAGGALGPTTYKEYCQIEGGYPAIIAASSSELAQAIRLAARQ